MIEIKVYMIMGECRIEAEFYDRSASHFTKVTWQEPLSDRSPVRDLTNAVTRALEALDGVMGEVETELRFGGAA